MRVAGEHFEHRLSVVVDELRRNKRPCLRLDRFELGGFDPGNTVLLELACLRENLALERAYGLVVGLDGSVE